MILSDQSLVGFSLQDQEAQWHGSELAGREIVLDHTLFEFLPFSTKALQENCIHHGPRDTIGSHRFHFAFDGHKFVDIVTDRCEIVESEAGEDFEEQGELWLGFGLVVGLQEVVHRIDTDVFGDIG